MPTPSPEEATSGPYQVEMDGNNNSVLGANRTVVCYCPVPTGPDISWNGGRRICEANAAKIAHQLNVFPALVAALQKSIATLEDMVAEFEDETGGAVEDRGHDATLFNRITECQHALGHAKAALKSAQPEVAQK